MAAPTTAERIFALRRHGHSSQEVSAVLGVDRTELEAFEADPSEVPTLPSGGGDEEVPDWWSVEQEGDDVAFIVGEGKTITVTAADGLTTPFIIQGGPGSDDEETDFFIFKDEEGNTRAVITTMGGLQWSDGGSDGYRFLGHNGDALTIANGGSNRSWLTVSEDSGGWDVRAPAVAEDGFNGEVLGFTGQGEIGFWDKAVEPTAQPAAPETLEDVIAALTVLGLVAEAAP